METCGVSNIIVQAFATDDDEFENPLETSSVTLNDGFWRFALPLRQNYVLRPTFASDAQGVLHQFSPSTMNITTEAEPLQNINFIDLTNNTLSMAFVGGLCNITLATVLPTINIPSCGNKHFVLPSYSGISPMTTYQLPAVEMYVSSKTGSSGPTCVVGNWYPYTDNSRSNIATIPSGAPSYTTCSFNISYYDSSYANGYYLESAPGTFYSGGYYLGSWNGFFTTPDISGSYSFQSFVDDGATLFVNNVAVILNLGDRAATHDVSGTITLQANTQYSFAFQCVNQGGGGGADLKWQLPGTSGFNLVPVYSSGSASVSSQSSGSSASQRSNVELFMYDMIMDR